MATVTEPVAGDLRDTLLLVKLGIFGGDYDISDLIDDAIGMGGPTMENARVHMQRRTAVLDAIHAHYAASVQAVAVARSEGKAEGMREVLAWSAGIKDDLRDRVAVFRDMEPEEDETWESWYYASFDMLIESFNEIWARAIPAPVPEQGERGDLSEDEITQDAALLATVTRERDEAREQLGDFVSDLHENDPYHVIRGYLGLARGRAERAEAALAAARQHAIEECIAACEHEIDEAFRIANESMALSSREEQMTRAGIAKRLADSFRALSSEPKA